MPTEGDEEAEIVRGTVCGHEFDAKHALESGNFDAPDYPDHGFPKYCPACWRGVGPEDLEAEKGS